MIAGEEGSRRRSAAPERPVTIVANRLPISQTDRGWRRSSGGLVTALAPLMSGTDGAWIGWDGGASRVPSSMSGMDVQLVPIGIDRAELNGYYHGFSNRTIWPLFHDLIEPARFDRTWWRHYMEVNERFASATVKHLKKTADDAIVWIHDYHLMLVPALVRAQLSRRILFFLHIPFPPPELFARLPWRREILEGLLGSDLVAFHTDRYRRNFVRTASRIVPGVKVSGARIVMPDGRHVLTAANPISIDADEFAAVAKSERVAEEREVLRKQFDGRKVLLGVDRLDYTKGIPERLDAYERLLENRADLRGKIALVQIAVPSRGSVREYRELRERVEQSVGRINGRFTEPGQDVPVLYIHRSVARERLVAYYTLADVMTVTPLKDGMNLVAKEYVVSQGAVGGEGALLLSEFTGAALELKEAMPCNPFDVDGLARSMEAALDLERDARRSAMKAMARRVARYDVHRWARETLEQLDRHEPDRLPAEAHL